MTIIAADRATSPLILSIGYEGRDQQSLIDELTAHGVGVLLDVRLTPLSRKRGLSKTALSEALHLSGIQYLHRRDLGNPKTNRESFRSGDTPTGVTVFKRVLASPESRSALNEAVTLARTERVAILCFEREHRACHRQVIVDEVARSSKAPVVLA